MDFRLTDDQQVLRRSVREFAEAEIGPHVMEWDEAQAFPPELVTKMAELGLMGIQFPEAYGGSGNGNAGWIEAKEGPRGAIGTMMLPGLSTLMFECVPAE